MRKAKQRIVKLDSDGWPDQLLIPEAEHFCFESFALGYDNRSTCGYVTPAFVTDCNTQGCLVGMIGMAFRSGYHGHGITPVTIKNPAAGAFLNTICKELNIDIGARCIDNTHQFFVASDEYESMQISGEKMAAAWRASAIKHGYDVEHLEDF